MNNNFHPDLALMRFERLELITSLILSGISTDSASDSLMSWSISLWSRLGFSKTLTNVRVAGRNLSLSSSVIKLTSERGNAPEKNNNHYIVFMANVKICYSVIWVMKFLQRWVLKSKIFLPNIRNTQRKSLYFVNAMDDRSSKLDMLLENEVFKN